MTLRTRTLAIVGITLLVLIGIQYLISRRIVTEGFHRVERDLVQGFDRIEKDDAVRNVRRVTDALNMRVENLSIKAADWAQWDDTYRFVVDKNTAFVESNLEDDALIALKINLILMYDNAGKRVFSTAFNLDSGVAVPVPSSLDPFLAPGSFLLSHRDSADVKAGIILLPEDPLMIVSRPICRSDGSGPVRGSFMFARFLDSTEFGILASLTHLAISRYRADRTGEIPPECTGVSTATGSAGVCILPMNEETIAGYTLVRDLQSKPALYLRVEIPRDIHRQGTLTTADIRARGRVILLSIVISILVAGLVLGFLIYMILERLVLRKLGRLSSKTSAIGSSGDFSGRVSAEGTDEMAVLGRSINTMLDALHASHRVIECRNGEMRLLMNTVPTGLFSFDENYKINPEFSDSATRILGTKDLQGKLFFDVIGLSKDRPQDRLKITAFLDCVRMELLPETEMAGLNPIDELPFVCNNETRWLHTRFFLIRRDGGLPAHILVEVEDITDEKKLKEQVRRSEGENMQLRAIAENPDLFREFLNETRAVLHVVGERMVRLTPGTGRHELVNEVFRGVHTIKGVAGSFGLSNVAEVAGRLENFLSPLRDTGEITIDGISETRQTLDALNLIFIDVVESSRKFLGEDGERESGILLRIPLDAIRRQIQDIQAMHIDIDVKDPVVARLKKEIVRRLLALQTVPARRGLARALKIIPDLCARLGKEIDVVFEGENALVDCEVVHALNTPLIHMIRNTMDHGIESAEERLAAGKPPRGTLRVSVVSNEHQIRVEVGDDGRGLDPGKLRSTAVRKGVISSEESALLTQEQAYELIFRPGFSTVDAVTDVSGRGVGMDAVLQTVKEDLGGFVEIRSEIGRGTAFIMTIPGRDVG